MFKLSLTMWCWYPILLNKWSTCLMWWFHFVLLLVWNIVAPSVSDLVTCFVMGVEFLPLTLWISMARNQIYLYFWYPQISLRSNCHKSMIKDEFFRRFPNQGEASSESIVAESADSWTITWCNSKTHFTSNRFYFYERSCISYCFNFFC